MTRHPVSAERGHRWFAAFYDRFAGRSEAGEYARDIRSRTAGRAEGRILEIGAGTGFNFPHYPEGAEVVATEPDPYMLRRAEARARARGIDLRAAPAERLPFPDAALDTVVTTGVLCAVDDPAGAAAEAFRVLRPAGALRFSEHVRAERPLRRAMQRTLDPIHYRLFRCHIGRDTVRVLREAGFEMDDLEHLQHADVLGVARKP